MVGVDHLLITRRISFTNRSLVLDTDIRPTPTGLLIANCAGFQAVLWVKPDYHQAWLGTTNTASERALPRETMSVMCAWTLMETDGHHSGYLRFVTKL